MTYHFVGALRLSHTRVNRVASCCYTQRGGFGPIGVGIYLSSSKGVICVMMCHGCGPGFGGKLDGIATLGRDGRRPNR